MSAGASSTSHGAIAPDVAARHRRASRIVWACLFVVPTIVLAIAAMLTPDPSGHGTHTQLGLPPCGFLVLTGYPCPGCGLTTAFAHMARLDVIGAAHANPFGILLFMVSFATIPVAGWGFVRAAPVFDTLERLHFEKWAILLCVTGVSVWVVRLVTLYFHL